MDQPRSPSHDSTPLADRVVVPVVAEELNVQVLRQATGTVRVRIESDEHDEAVRRNVVRDRVEVQRVPRNEPAAEAREPWHDGDVLVVPVYEERLVVEKRLFLKEELRIVTLRSETPVEAGITLQRQRAVVERLQPDGRWLARDDIDPITSTPYHPEGTPMSQTIVSVYDNRADAREASEAVQRLGIDADRIRITDEGPGSTAATSSDNGHERGGVRQFFADLFGSDDDVEERQYGEAVKRGSTIVRVTVDDESEAQSVRQVLETGSYDLEARSQQWTEGGWDGGAPIAAAATAAGSTVVDTAAPTRPAAATNVAGSALAETGSEAVIPVIQEELQVGKRTVNLGKVRVFSRTTERPVGETVTLHRTTAEIERHPVDRPATEAELSALQDRTIEIEETAETPVVAKSARVVEEVVVGRAESVSQETVHDTVRSTEVEVQNDASGSAFGGTQDSASGRSSAALGDWDDSAYREDYQSRYASLGGSYDDYAPAYRYGHESASDPSYTGRDWDAAEPTLRSGWESRHPGGTWERVKDAVKHAFSPSRESR